jgi:hypothetical protein
MDAVAHSDALDLLAGRDWANDYAVPRKVFAGRLIKANFSKTRRDQIDGYATFHDLSSRSALAYRSRGGLGATGAGL